MVKAVITYMLLLLLSGCASVDPYLELGVGYQIDRNTDYWLQTKRDWQCSKQPQFHGEVGIEFDDDWTIGYHHQSWIHCGGPFNNHPEVWTDDIRITKKWGGKK